MKPIRIIFWSSLTIFLVLLSIMLIRPQLLQPLDNVIRVIINAHRTSFANQFFTHFTQLFNSTETIIWTIAVIIMSRLLADWQTALQSTLTMGSGILLNRAVKLLIRRPRPSVDILMHYGSFSFPSGHSSAAALIVGCLIILASKIIARQWFRRFLIVLLIILTLAVGFSRIYVGAHYPSDVLAGWCLGVAVVTGFQLIFTQSQK